jgi:hypothetical protein
MRTVARFALANSLTAALLAGCSGSQPPLSAPGALPQAAAIAPSRSTAHRLSASYQQLFRFHPPQTRNAPHSAIAGREWRDVWDNHHRRFIA